MTEERKVSALFGYCVCVVSAAVMGGLWYAMSLLDAAVWLWIIVVGSVLPIYVFFGICYLGGLCNGIGKFFRIKIVEEDKAKQDA